MHLTARNFKKDMYTAERLKNCYYNCDVNSVYLVEIVL